MTSPQGRMRPAHRPTRRLSEIAAWLGVTTPVDREITGIAIGSADVAPGDLFAAVGGLRAHGADYAGQAVAAGAAAVLTDAAGAERIAATGLDVPVLVTDRDMRPLVGALSAWLYGEPADGVVTVGVTGTNGKTTTTYFVDAALRRVHERTAVIGTVELKVADEAIESPRTTVEAPVLHGLFALMRERGVTACAMEVSSHALALERVAGLKVDVAGFTNLQRDHLDFHGDMDGYFRDKARLFAPERAARAVVCVDDEWGVRLAAEARIPVDTVATRDDSAGRATAGWRVSDADVGLDGVGSTFRLTGPDGEDVAASSPLPGLVNVSNAAVAIVLAHRAGVSLDDAVAGVAAATAIPGRMERVVERTDGWPLCLVDYAHTPDALVLALQAVRPITPGRLVLVLGSDGDRDRGKRPIMGRIAAELADVVVVTDENPRSEPPETIRAAILDGAREARPDLRDVFEVAPRAEALRFGTLLAGPLDTVIVTGKGHEPTQEIAGVFHRYNDRDVYRAVHADGRRGPIDPAELLGERAVPASPVVDVGSLTLLDATSAHTAGDIEDAIRALRRTAVQRRRIAVIGVPTGPATVTELDGLGRLAVRLDVQRLAAVGRAARAVHTGAYQEGSWDAESVHLPDVASVREWLADELSDGDVLLVAGAGAELAELVADVRAGVVAP
ncbi:UDP-N-acetylmuramoyl-L-alanyl-D-glutamate--2,6-diaminopimelate ligase [Actinotalea sp. M2MS4P-6]|uniref:UDP-N-acetylmuramoyl-L-alanyl-D-glutamate--2, 6-diaminopimelate ligase n=1 Tax=Actinotalea sp. M2MS4P-6 TaxID=2983762 RepID=UPI0021E507C6|nr:UDP-N-acetylmuramoyl-L-alanyl-D-glutamate--2,6-diaminopimelate ligase [Actinotalea sp. M2MS4P-6]MCV2393424.1 UDP-N-acetylmuramoyl-L-alanyl-D-glutamate--2,6-diaminopimelate ligase [Actinotalea sp. M2MS4P-6]